MKKIQPKCLYFQVSRVPVRGRTNITGISLKSAGFIKLPIRTEILLVASVFLVSFLFTCHILVTSLPYLSDDGLMFFCFLLCGGFKFAIVA